jgi:hypothetical protein
MRKFILIDQSIKDAGGHHLEYALRVLKAAKNLGFKSILGTHKECGDVISEHIDIVDKAFSHTFWENFQSEFIALDPKERRLINKIKIKKDQLIYDLMCSSLGFSYMAAHQGLSIPDMFSRYGSATSGKRLSAVTILSGYFLARLNDIRRKSSKKFDRFSNATRRLKRFMWMTFVGLLGLTLSPILLPYILTRWNRIFGRSNVYASQFSEDIQRLLVRVNAANGDIVFIPTLGNVELIGSSICSDRLPFQNLAWHFLFRRNLFQGREPSYQLQIEKQFKVLQAFSAYKLGASGANVSFYTDTDALTEQYNRLGLFKFTTLPIPLDESLERSKDANDRQVNITYIGDARDEKGFPLLPRLVGDLRAAGYTENEIKFTFQSNFNVPGGELGSRIAKAELSMDLLEQVNLVDGPFDSDEYTNLVNKADILLVPYDAYNYYARSSGVFAEALVAGIPVVTSDKSWMSQELFNLNQNYYRELLRSKKTLQTKSLGNSKNHSQLLVRPYSSGDYTWLLLEITQLLEKPGQYMHINWKSSPESILRADSTASFFRQFTVDLRSTATYSLLRLPKKERLLLEFEIDDGLGNVFPLAKIGAIGLAISAHELHMETNTPLFQACGLFCQEEDFSAAVIEVIQKHEQYSMHCQELRKTWMAFHDSEVLVKMLDGVSK